MCFSEHVYEHIRLHHCLRCAVCACRPRGALTIENVFGERHLTYRVEAVRLGLFFGVFSGGYKALLSALKQLTGGNSKYLPAIAGGVAGLSISFLDPELCVSLVCEREGWSLRAEWALSLE